MPINSSDNIKITIMNKDSVVIKEFYMLRGANLWVFLRKEGLPIGSACSGVGVCAACDVFIHGDPNTVSVQNDFEKKCLERNQKALDMRLACLCRVYQDVCVSAKYW